MGRVNAVVILARVTRIVVVATCLVMPHVVLAQSCGGAGSPGGALGAALFGTQSAALSATLGAGFMADPSLKSLLSAPPSCAPAEAASRESSVPSVAAGNPVDLVTGAKVERAIDIHLPVGSPGVADPMDFVFARHYSSSTREASVLGPGWRHSFETRLLAQESRHGPQPYVLQADGRRIAFTRRYRLAGGGVRRQAARHDDGVLDERPGVADATWVWRWRSGRQLVFDGGGRLVRVVTADRDAIALRYGDDGRLVVIADNRGHRIDLRYDDADAASPGRLAALSFPGGHATRYTYDEQGRLVRVDHHDGARVRYHYDDAAVASRLTGVTLPNGARSEYRYDAGGRVVWSRAAGAVESDALRFVYAPNRGSPASGSTQVSWGADESARAVYRWRVAPDGVPQLEAGSGDQCASCPPVARRYGWSPRGDLASIEAGGARLEFVRDTRGRLLLAKHVGVGTRTTALLAEVRWQDDAVFDLVARVRRPSVVPSHWRETVIGWNADAQPVTLEERGYSPVMRPMDGDARLRPEAISRSVRFDYAEAGPARGTLSDVSEPQAGLAWQLRHDASRARVPDARLISQGWSTSLTATPAGMLATAAAAIAAGASIAHNDPRTGQLRLITRGGRVVEVTFDDFDRAVRVRSEEGGVIERRYDTAGRLVSEHLAGVGSAVQRWDERGRLLEYVVRDVDGKDTRAHYRYVDEHLASIEHPGQAESFEHDADGRLRSRVISIRRPEGGEIVARLQYHHDADTGELTGRSLAGGASLHFHRDASGHIVAVTQGEGAPRVTRTLVKSVQRSPIGVVQMTYGNGVESRSARDPLGVGLRTLVIRPGAFSWSRSGVLSDERLRFDARGLPSSIAGAGTVDRALHDRDGRLLQLIREDARGTRAWRYVWDSDGARRISDEPTSDGAATRRVIHDVAGRVLDDGRYRYRWSASGQVIEVSGPDGVVARYRYNHRGERIAKEVGGRVTYFVYDHRQLIAELNAQGQVEREYVWLADWPVAIIDRDGEHRARVTFLHVNHLGAPVLATDAAGAVAWRAEYAPFGRATTGPPAMSIALRLPGQYEDAETGLHYNDHRYYDPDRGRYLSPDPIGLQGGPDPYAYAAGSPLRNVDPSGLLLFAFDGTGNSDSAPKLDDWSNVYKLSRTYADGRVWYMSGVGTDDAASGIKGGASDALFGSSASARVDWMLGQLDQTASQSANRGHQLQIDVIGFSRGAAMARDFSNRVASYSRDGHFTTLGACVRLRFLGLWDTVAQFGPAGVSNLAWKLSVPAEVVYAAQAVALNEHRILFPAESIMGGTGGGTRIERGFVGAHSDIGGGYAEGDLSDVALVWMREQAVAAGVPMFALTSEFQRVTDPWLHDSSGGSGDREFQYRNSLGLVVASPLQRVARVDGLDWRGSSPFITRLPVAQADAYGDPTLAARVDMNTYSAWLQRNYAISVGAP